MKVTFGLHRAISCTDVRFKWVMTDYRVHKENNLLHFGPYPSLRQSR